MVKVNKKKNVNNNNVLKIESEHLRLAILLNNNLEFQYKWNLIYKYILIFIKFSTHFYYIYRNKMHAIFVLNVLNDCVRDVPIYIYINTWIQLKINWNKIAKRAWKSEDVNCEIFIRIYYIFHKEQIKIDIGFSKFIRIIFVFLLILCWLNKKNNINRENFNSMRLMQCIISRYIREK